MKTNKPMYNYADLKKGLLSTLKITLVIGSVFFILNKNYSLNGALLTYGISLLYSFTLGFGNGIINVWLDKKWDWISQTNQRLNAGIVFTITYAITGTLLVNYLIYVVVLNYKVENFFSGKLIWIHLIVVLITLIIASFLHAVGFMKNWKASVKQETKEQKIVAKTETAKFESLKSQLDPHFLFNSLNVLTSLIHENPRAAEKFTTKLSKVYRYVLEQRNKDLVPIQEELQFAKTYMELLQMRFEDAVEFTIAEDLYRKEVKLVPLSLQLLLENAVKHNVVSEKKPLSIHIYEENNRLIIKNNKNHKEVVKAKSTKVGLQNIADRYGLVTKEPVMIDDTNTTFAISLPLLIKQKEIMRSVSDIENTKYYRAVEKVNKIKDFYRNLLSYIIVIPILIYINLRFSNVFHWFWFPVIGWGMGVLFHGLEAFGFGLFLGKGWENRKIKELMNDEEFQRKI